MEKLLTALRLVGKVCVWARRNDVQPSTWQEGWMIHCSQKIYRTDSTCTLLHIGSVTKKKRRFHSWMASDTYSPWPAMAYIQQGWGGNKHAIVSYRKSTSKKRVISNTAAACPKALSADEGAHLHCQCHWWSARDAEPNTDKRSIPLLDLFYDHHRPHLHHTCFGRYQSWS
jgi:hypothetical protein